MSYLFLETASGLHSVHACAGKVEEFMAPKEATYKLEVWGAQGGSYSTLHGGYGAYAVGDIVVKSEKKLYIQVGQKGFEGDYKDQSGTGFNVPYPNGGGTKNSGIYEEFCNIPFGAGGGSTNVLAINTNINQMVLENIYIIGAGGGGACGWWYNEMYEKGANVPGGNAGGIEGCSTETNFMEINATGGTQTSGGLGGGNQNGLSRSDTSWLAGRYGEGGGIANGNTNTEPNVSGGGGGGLYGGGASWGGSGAGGSSYIGNSVLVNKHMTGYNVKTSNDYNTRTISVTSVSSLPKSDTAKSGNGYALISQH